MKLLKIGTTLQMIYCGICLISIVCMLLYAGFSATAFGEGCMKVGTIIVYTLHFNLLGVIGSVMNFIGCYSTELKRQKKYFVWTIVSPVLVIFCNRLAMIVSFVVMARS